MRKLLILITTLSFSFSTKVQYDIYLMVSSMEPSKKQTSIKKTTMAHMMFLK